MSYPSYSEWFQTLSQADQDCVTALVEQFRRMGANSPESWARSEFSENIPQLARFLFLHRFWPEIIDSWEDTLDRMDSYNPPRLRKETDPFADSYIALSRLLKSGVSKSDLRAITRMVAFEAVFAVLDRIDEGADLTNDAIGWVLMETNADEELTGRHVGCLHESILVLDPSGRDGRPSIT